MKPAIQIFLNPTTGAVTINGEIEDDGLNLQLLLKSAEAVAARLSQRQSGVQQALKLVVPGARR